MAGDILAVPGSVQFLKVTHHEVQHHLVQEAAAKGVPANRLVFGAQLERGDYLALMTVCDLFSDTWPYNAGTTGSVALWVACQSPPKWARVWPVEWQRAY